MARTKQTARKTAPPLPEEPENPKKKKKVKRARAKPILRRRDFVVAPPDPCPEEGQIRVKSYCRRAARKK